MCFDKQDDQTYTIIGAAMEVHRELGYGFLEAVYEDALEVELLLRKIPFLRQCPIPVLYKSEKLKSFYRCDFLCYEEVIVELKALSNLGGTEGSQILHYLKATELNRGLLLNFGKSSLEYKRFIRER